MLLLLLFLSSTPSGFEQISRQATVAREQNRLDDAIGLYRKALQLRPAWTEGQWFLGTLLYDRDQYAAGRDVFRRLVELDPKGSPGWVLLGLCEFQTKEFEASLRDLRRAQTSSGELDRQLADAAAFHRALLLTHFGQFEFAEKELMTLAQAGREDASLQLAIGAAALRNRWLPDEVPEDQRPLTLRAGKALLLTAQRKPAEAQQEFAALLREYPETPEVHFVYGSTLLYTDPEAGVRQLQRELEIAPRNVPAMASLALEFLKEGEPAKALPYARAAAQADPENFAAHYTLGKALADSGDLPNAVIELEVAVKMAPDVAQTRFALASAYSKAGRKDDAAREQREFLRLKREGEKHAAR